MSLGRVCASSRASDLTPPIVPNAEYVGRALSEIRATVDAIHRYASQDAHSVSGQMPVIHGPSSSMSGRLAQYANVAAARVPGRAFRIRRRRLRVFVPSIPIESWTFKDAIVHQHVPQDAC